MSYERTWVGVMVGRLPADTRAVLARGPVPWGSKYDDDPDGDCRICAALDRWFNGSSSVDPVARRAGDAAVRLIDWHQGPGCESSTAGMELIGRGPEAFRRCVMVYHAAGWHGPVQGPPSDLWSI